MPCFSMLGTSVHCRIGSDDRADTFLLNPKHYRSFRKSKGSDVNEVFAGYIISPAGRRNRIRTCDPLLPGQALYQAELYAEVMVAAAGFEPAIHCGIRV